MIRYRKAIPEDNPKVYAYCLEKGVHFEPQFSRVVFIAEDDNTGEIKGIVGLKVFLQCEPFAAENPLVGQVLAEKALAVAEHAGEPAILALTNQKEMVTLFERYGFCVLEPSLTLMRKEF